MRGRATARKRRSALAVQLGASLVLAALLGGPAVAAETIASALSAAYLSNPTLQAERARQRATDEQVPQALSGWRPTVIANGDVGAEWRLTEPGRTGTTNPAGFSINLSQPIFRGFRTVNQTRLAEANIAAGKQNLLAVEQQVLLDATTAFMNVLRDREIVRLRQRNVVALQEQLRASEARFSVGEITRTDVEQSKARLAQAEAELAVARANLAQSVGFFVQVIGRPPGALRYPAVSSRVPKSLEEALALAERLNPQILAAAFNAEAARHNVEFVKGDLLPRASLEAGYQFRHEPSPAIERSEQAIVQGAVEVPLYQAGRVASQVREAKQIASQRRIEIIEAGRAVREAVVRTWNVYVAAGQTIESFKAQVAANELALEGVRQEALVGTRTTLDVLDADRELVESQVALVTAQRDQIVAAYQLIAATGRMTARDLGLAVPYYDPDEHALKVRRRFWGTAAETID